MNTASIAEAPEGPSTQFLRQCAQKHDLWVCGSVPVRESSQDKPYNTLILSDPRGSLTLYRKIHPFTFAREHEHYAAGSNHVTVDLEGLRVTLLVCYDLRFANEFWDTATATDCYVVVANWPAKRREHWRTLLRARAIENQAFVVGVNRTGIGNAIEYIGDSCVIDPWGACLVTAAKDETLILADVDPQAVVDARTRFPVLADRHPG